MIASNPVPTPSAPPLVSIVIPSYNCDRYIDQTLASILAQTHTAIEIIVVDDGSTDRTTEIVGGYGDPVRLIRQSNQGVSRARNAGFAASRGDFVCFMDHDDYWHPWKLKRQLQAIGDDTEIGVVSTDFMTWTPAAGVYPDPVLLAPDDSTAPGHVQDLSGWIYHRFLTGSWVMISTAMVRRAAIERCGGFDPDLPYSEDWEFWLRLSREFRFIKIDRSSTLYRQHPEQGSRRLRDVDYATQLLEKTVARWGLTSRDGRRIGAGEFKRNLGAMHMQFGLHHLEHGNVRIAVRSFLRAWSLHPARAKYGALVAAALLGWKPSPTP